MANTRVYDRDALAHLFRMQARTIDKIAELIENREIDPNEFIAQKLNDIDDVLKGRNR